MLSTLSKGVCSDVDLAVVVDEVGAGDETADADDGFAEGAKNTVKVAGPVLSSVRSTVIDTAGLWYLRRGRY